MLAATFDIVPLGDDFSLMAPFGGIPSHGPYTPEQVRIGDFFRNGSFTQDEVARYETPDMVVLAVIEHAVAVEVGGLSAQDWDLRVTLVYRRDADGWRLVPFARRPARRRHQPRDRRSPRQG